MHLHHYIPNRVIVLQDGTVACAVCADANHAHLAETTNQDVYNRIVPHFAPNPMALAREFISKNPQTACDSCRQEC